MKLIIAEKPNVAKQLKEALEPSATYIKTKTSGYYKGKNFIFGCALGHLIVQQLPKEIDESWGKFDLESLPYDLPKPIPQKIGKSPASGYYSTLKELVTKESFDEIIVATDPDREGQGIYERIKSYTLSKWPKVKESRIWIKEWTKEGLQEAFDTRDDNANHKGLGDAAECRAYIDYVLGMNGTAACTDKFGNGTLLSVGRVQTPVTYIIVARENEILNFKPEKYQALSIETESDEDEHLILDHKSKERLNSEEAASLLNRVKNHKDITLSVASKKSSKKPSKLGGQTDFLQTMNKLYGFDAKKTSNLLQTLYQDEHLTTYPGTEAHEISESAAKEALKPLKNLVGKVDAEVDAWVQKILDNKWTISSNCVTNKELAHEAITPVFGSINEGSVQKLSDDARKCYKEIIKRYVQAFFPPAIFNETVVSGELEGETFEAKGKVLLEPGFMEVMGSKKDSIIPKVTDGRAYAILDFRNVEKETEPPKRYTEATLLDAMKNAGRFVEDKKYADILKSEEVEGLGTGRTRSVILDTLKQRHYYELKKKSIYATKTAMDLIAVLPEDMVLMSPIMTAQMEEELKQVEEGQLSKSEYMKQADQMVLDMIHAIKQAKGCVSNSSYKIVGTCPVCGEPLVDKGKKIECLSHKYKKSDDGSWIKTSGCSFDGFWNTIAKKKLTLPQIKDLAERGETGYIKGFKSKTGKDFEAKVVLDKATGKTSFIFRS